MKNYYTILGLEETASAQEINEAYKKLALKFHPDKNDGDPYYSHLFKEATEARNILTDRASRAEFDFNLTNYKEAYQLFKTEQDEREFNRTQRKQQFEANRNKRRVYRGLAAVAAAACLLVVFLMPDREDKPKAKAFFATSTTDSVANTPPAKVVDSSLVLNTPAVNTEVTAIADRPLEDQPGTRDKPVVVKETFPQNEQERLEVSTPPVQTDKRKLASSEINDILQELSRYKQLKAGASACIQLQQTRDSNIEDAFTIASLLQQKGYLIAGRQIVTAEVNGAHIEEGNECMRLVIGRF